MILNKKKVRARAQGNNSDTEYITGDTCDDKDMASEDRQPQHPADYQYYRARGCCGCAHDLRQQGLQVLGPLPAPAPAPAPGHHPPEHVTRCKIRGLIMLQLQLKLKFT